MLSTKGIDPAWRAPPPPLAEVYTSHIVDSPGEVHWLRIGDEEINCNHFEEEARQIVDLIDKAIKRENAADV